MKTRFWDATPYAYPPIRDCFVTLRFLFIFRLISYKKRQVLSRKHPRRGRWRSSVESGFKSASQTRTKSCKPKVSYSNSWAIQTHKLFKHISHRKICPLKYNGTSTSKWRGVTNSKYRCWWVGMGIQLPLNTPFHTNTHPNRCLYNFCLCVIDQRTDRRTDKALYRVAWPRLKWSWWDLIFLTTKEGDCFCET